MRRLEMVVIICCCGLGGATGCVCDGERLAVCVTRGAAVSLSLIAYFRIDSSVVLFISRVVLAPCWLDANRSWNRSRVNLKYVLEMEVK